MYHVLTTTLVLKNAITNKPHHQKEAASKE